MSHGKSFASALIALIGLLLAMGLVFARPTQPSSVTPLNADVRPAAAEVSPALLPDENVLPDCRSVVMGADGQGGDAKPDAPDASCKVPETVVDASNSVAKHPIPLESANTDK